MRDKKVYTILIASDRKGKTRHFTLPSFWLKCFSSFCLLSLILTFSVAVDYVSLLWDARLSDSLYLENEKLKRQFEVVEGKVQSLERDLERIKNFSTKLKLVTNIDDKDRVLRLAIGPTSNIHFKNTHFKSPHSKNSKAEDQHSHSSDLRGRFLDSYNSMTSSVGGQQGFHNHAHHEPFKPPSSKQEQNSFAQKRESELFSFSEGKSHLLSIRIDKATKEASLREQDILKLWEALSDRRSLLKATPSINPVRSGWMTSKFGYRIDPFLQKSVMHNGIDIAARHGSPVYAPADGIVSFISFGASYGKLLEVDHGYGVVTRYAHNSQINVKVGERIERGHIIASVGDTGRSTGPHLHYEVRVNGIPVDPLSYIFSE